MYISRSSDHTRQTQLGRSHALIVTENAALLADHHRVQRTRTVGRRRILAGRHKLMRLGVMMSSSAICGGGGAQQLGSVRRETCGAGKEREREQF